MTSELTADLITATWRPDTVRLSPDGDRVAWSASPYGQAEEHGESAIWVGSVDGTKPARRWSYGGKDVDPQWSPDGTRIAFRSDRRERGTLGLYVLHVDGGDAKPLVVRKRSVGAFCWSPDGRRIAFCAPDAPDEEDTRREKERDDPDVYGERRRYHRLRLVDLDSGEITTLFGEDLHVVDVAWAPGGSTVAFTTQDTLETDDMMRQSLWVVDVDTGQSRRLLERQAGLGDLTWTGDGSALAYVSPHEGLAQGSYSVWAVGTAAEAAPCCIGTGQDEPACSLGVRAGDDDQVAILVMEGLDSRLEWASTSSGSRSVVWRADGDILEFDVAGGVVAAVASPGSGAPEVWVGVPGSMRQVSHHHDDWTDVPLGSVEDFAFTASDGLELDGVLIRPPEDTEGANATVVLVHGGPYGRSGRSLHGHPLDWGQWLATAGYTVLMPNYRGGLGHGHAFATSVRGDMGGAEWGDVMAAVDAAVERGIADPERLGIGGWSQGGFLTAWAVTQTVRFRAAVMGAGVSDWGAMAALSDVPTMEAALGGDTPWDGPGPHRAVQRSPISYAADRRTPLLILHGQQDVRVPVGQATAFHRALRAQDVPVEMVTYPREPHGVSERAHQVDLLNRVRKWYDDWLGQH